MTKKKEPHEKVVRKKKEPKLPKEKKQKKGYFDNTLMLDLMKERNQLTEEIETFVVSNIEEESILQSKTIALDKIENKIGQLYKEVANGMMRRPNFINYPPDQKDEMISDALYCMVRAGAKYDVNFPNPFGYLSQITFHAFIQSIKNMKKRTGTFVNIEHIENLNEGMDEWG